MSSTTHSSHDVPAMVHDYGDRTAEFRALMSGCGVYDLRGRSKVVLTGDDRVRWLNGMTTNNVRDLAAGHGVYAFLLNPQGHIQADLYAFQRGEHILVDFEGELRDKVLGLFDHYIIADDVAVADVSAMLVAIGLSGPQSIEVLKRAGIVVPELEPLQLTDLVWDGLGITLLRSGEEAAPSWQVWMAGENFAKVWGALVAAGAVPSGSTALELFRIAKGIPRYGVDIRALHFAKGCYVGQEIVERIRSRGAVHRVFSGFLVDGPLPAVGTKIQVDAKDVGEITSAAVLPLERGPRAVALGYIRREAISGRELVAGEGRVTVSEVPFPS
jgi:folate-binding Fe-S cluster repair protein YgfZ